MPISTWSNPVNALSLAQKKLQFLKIFKDEFNEAKMQRVKDNGVVKVTTFFLSDEFHNILGRHSLDGEKGEEMKEILTTGRNAGLIFGGVVRRLADASTVFVESCNTYLFGLSGGDNDLRKIRNETDSKEVRDMVAGLRPRSFIFYDKERKAGFDIGMPDFYPVGKPYEIKVDYSRGYVKPFYL